jgi:hypothetical protein
MGTLIAMRYRLALTANLADHTYVVCGDGAKKWGCWGDDGGGTPLRSGVGSTRRADAIAGGQARAGIACYLINGVCHQAANRVLLPAGITVRGAAGYDVSEALFGPYGRPHGLAGLCPAPFRKRAGIDGDLAPGPVRAEVFRPGQLSAAARADERVLRRRERRYLAAVQALYGRAAVAWTTRASFARHVDEAEGFQMALFRLKVAYQLPSAASGRMALRLDAIRRATERVRLDLERSFLHGDLTPLVFAHEFNGIVLAFQEAAAGVLGRHDYRALLGGVRQDAYVLADPAVVEQAYAGAGPRARPHR